MDYQLNLAAILGLCAALFFSKQRNGGTEKNGGPGPQLPFLAVYSLVMGADWLQGPFLYSLLRDEHRVSSHLVSALFTTGFVSGALSGSFVGSLADRHGRKAACLCFCAVYALSCLLTTIPSVPLLFAGRALGGLGTSLLFSVLESWMVTDFHRRGLADKGADLSRTFGLMSTLNSVVAIVSGVSSEWLVGVAGTRKAPLVASIALLGLAFWIILARWDENFGDVAGSSRPKPDLRTTLADPRVLSLGLASTVFEGSMYLFVFFWAPALESVQTSHAELPYGIVFASFMASILASSLLFDAVVRRQLVAHNALLVAILGIAGVCLFSGSRPGSEQATFWVFCLFEAAVGMYWPCMGYLKGRAVDDRIRAQVYSLLRIPLNVFVVVSLLITGGDGSFRSVLSACSTLLLGSSVALGVGLTAGGDSDSQAS